MDQEDILSRIEEAKPDILLVAFGNPKQEKWIAMHRHRLKVPVCIGVGGSFDFLSGRVSRAPLMDAAQRARVALSDDSRARHGWQSDMPAIL